MTKMHRSVRRGLAPRRQLWLALGACALWSALIGVRAADAVPPPSPAGSLQVLHWWTSASERRAIDVLVRQLAKQGIQWRDMPIPGGAGTGANKVLKSMVLANRAPEVTQLNGVVFGEWAELGLLLELDGVATPGNWEKQMFPTAWSLINNRNHVVAVPLGIHRINNLYYNQAIFSRLGLVPPRNWDEFMRVADALRRAGITPLAQSAEGWQLATLFENLVLAESGPAYYRQLLVEMNPRAYGDARLLQVLRRLRQMGTAMEKPLRERSWWEVARSLADGEAGMFIMGDWAKGELNAMGLTADQQFGCAAFPGTEQFHLYSVDTLAMFAGDYSHQGAQEALAQMAVSPAIQAEYNKIKGSIPVWRSPEPVQMDRCTRDSWRVFSKGAAYQAPSLVHRMASEETTKDAIIGEVQRFFLDPRISEEEAQRRLAAIARTLSRPRAN